MNTEDSFSFSGRIRSFEHAFRGIGLMVRTQHNAWLHALATVVVFLLGMVYQLTAGEWCWIIIATVAVWTAEALNTAFEFLCDVASPEFHPMVKNAKDVAAGAVLLSAIGAICIGGIVLGPHVVRLFE